MNEKILNVISAILNDPAAAEHYLKNSKECLLKFHLTEEEQNIAFSYLSPLQELRRIQQASQENMLQQQLKIDRVNESFRNGITQANDQTITGFRATMIMYQISFYLGIALIITAVIFAFIAHSALFSIIFGSIGTLDLLTFFIAKPPQDLQKSRSEQAKLNAVFYSWFVDLYNWNSYFTQFSVKGKIIDLTTMKEVSQMQIENTERLMKIIGEHINTSPQ